MKKLLYLVLALGLTTYLESCKEDDPCESVNCLNGGNCVDGTCVCPEGFDGATCQTEDLCITQEVSCGDNGECVDGECDCKSKYYGDKCEDKCVRGDYDDGTCTCEQGIEGSSCEVVSRRRFCGTYALESDFVVNPPGGLICSIDSAAKFDEEIWKVSMTNLSSKKDGNGYAEVKGNVISVPSQTVKDQDGTLWVVKSVAGGQYSAQGFTLTISRKLKDDPNATEQEGECVYTPN